MQNLSEIQRSRIPHYLSQHWRDLHRQGTSGYGSHCQPTVILNVQAVRFGELKSTNITLSVKIPKGIIEDVLVKIDKFYYPMDFVVLDTEPMAKSTNQVPIILGRPFLATSNAIINCRNGVMQLTFGNMTLELNIFHLSNKDKPAEDEEQKSEEVCLSGTGVGKHSAHKLQEELSKTQEAVNEGSTTSVTLPASVIPPAPPESRMLNTKEQKLNSTAAHLTASMGELLLLDPP